jgi:hypothetical protein
MTTTPPPDCANAWRTLDIGGGTDEFSIATVKLDLDTGYGAVRIARGRRGEAQLLIPTEVGRRLPDALSGDGVGVQIVQYLVTGRTRPFIEMSCLADDLKGPFRSLVDDVLRRLSDGNGPEQAVSAAILQFRSLLRRRPHSLAEIVGLFGELSLLWDLVQLNPDAARCWTGPLRQRHDFSAGTLCAEVKSTLQRDARHVHISSLDQLSAPEDGRPLYLFHVVLERSGHGGLSVAELIQQMLPICRDPSLLTQALESPDIPDWRSDPRYSMERFVLLRTEVYHVAPGFPRLDVDSFVPGCPPAGVLKIEYRLDLDHARRFLLPAEEVPSLLTRLAGHS